MFLLEMVNNANRCHSISITLSLPSLKKKITSLFKDCKDHASFWKGKSNLLMKLNSFNEISNFLEDISSNTNVFFRLTEVEEGSDLSFDGASNE